MMLNGLTCTFFSARSRRLEVKKSNEGDQRSCYTLYLRLGMPAMKMWVTCNPP